MKATVPANSPALCRDCRGRGCVYCTRGLVCPACRGRRVSDEGRVCRVCCEGNQINPRKELAAIMAYLGELQRAARLHRRTA